jgi:hypothetical protein
MIWRWIFLLLVGCGLVTVRAQPHEEVRPSGFSRAVADCTNVPIIFDVSYDRGAFLSSSGLDLKQACVVKDAKFKLLQTITDIGLPSESDCGGAPRGTISFHQIAMEYDYTQEGTPKTDIKTFDCPEGSRTLNFAGDPELLKAVLDNCFAKVEVQAELVRLAMNAKAPSLRFYGIGSCSEDFCGALSLDVRFSMSEASINLGDPELCK